MHRVLVGLADKVTDLGDVGDLGSAPGLNGSIGSFAVLAKRYDFCYIWGIWGEENMEKCGKMWKNMEKHGKTWKNMENIWKTSGKHVDFFSPPAR
jgi:hypothetical protein